jgi:predicted Zn finger-like uncharacterized protein
MLIVCPNCATSYRVEPSSLGATGRSVRCVRCRNVWFARDPAPLEAIAQAHRADIEALTGAPPPPDPSPSLAAEAPESSSPDEASPPELAEAAEPPSETGLPPQPAEGYPLPQSADPIAIADAPALAPMGGDAALLADAVLGEDIETVAARRSPRRSNSRWRRSLLGLPLAILALVALDAALIAWRADVVRVAPQTASLYAAIGLPVNLRGLSFTDVATATETHDGVQVLVVEGTIASASARAVEVPRLRFSVRNASGQEVYAWTALPARNVLAPGETLPFRSRLASPPPDTRDVLVRFFNRRDLVAGLQRSEGEDRERSGERRAKNHE